MLNLVYLKKKHIRFQIVNAFVAVSNLLGSLLTSGVMNCAVTVQFPTEKT